VHRLCSAFVVPGRAGYTHCWPTCGNEPNMVTGAQLCPSLSRPPAHHRQTRPWVSTGYGWVCAYYYLVLVAEQQEWHVFDPSSHLCELAAARVNPPPESPQTPSTVPPPQCAGHLEIPTRHECTRCTDLCWACVVIQNIIGIPLLNNGR
jgi:hypothetical protein